MMIAANVIIIIVIYEIVEAPAALTLSIKLSPLPSFGEGVGSGVGSGVGPGVGGGVGPGVGFSVGLFVGSGVGSGVGPGVALLLDNEKKKEQQINKQMEL
jgi:hypothetical protein